MISSDFVFEQKEAECKFLRTQFATLKLGLK